MSVTFVSWRCSCSGEGLSVNTKMGFCHSPASLNVCAMSVDRKPRIANVTIASTSVSPLDPANKDVDPPLIRPTVLLAIHTNPATKKARHTNNCLECLESGAMDIVTQHRISSHCEARLSPVLMHEIVVAAACGNVNAR
eukprot:scaffold206506_cov55-Attheya_sp.AAC.3